MGIVKLKKGGQWNYTVYKDAIYYMDNEIREKLHSKLCPCSDQIFFTSYCKLHEKKFGNSFLSYLYTYDNRNELRLKIKNPR